MARSLGCIMISFQFFAIPQGFWGRNPKYREGNVKGLRKLHYFWIYKAL
jgi:hypothetical protein